MFINDLLPGFKKIRFIWAAVFIPLLWDILQLVFINMSGFLGYNLHLDHIFALLKIDIRGWNFSVLMPQPLPSIQQMNMLKSFNQDATVFNYTWSGYLAYGAYLFFSGLVMAGFLGTIKDSVRNRAPRYSTGLQFAWYYGPRLFLILGFQALFHGLLKLLESFLLINVMIFNIMIFCLDVIIIFTCYIAVAEDYGVIEALSEIPFMFIRHIRYFGKFVLSLILVASAFFTAFNKIGPWAWLIALMVWPGIGTVLAYDIMTFINEVVLKEPLENQPREQLRGYRQNFIKSLVLIAILATIAGVPNVISKSQFIPALLPWHEPVMEKQGYIYQTSTGLLLANQNYLGVCKVVIDGIHPSKDEILSTQPDFIRGKGRLLTGFNTIYFTFELEKTKGDKAAVYSLQHGGKIEATDGIWGNPLERGLLLAVSTDLKFISGVIYDKRGYTGFNTLWARDRKTVFLSPLENKPDLYGFYASDDLPKTAVEFQWLYNEVLPILPGYEEPIDIMEKLNVAFETLDFDMLLKILYYAGELELENVLSDLRKQFEDLRWSMESKGLDQWKSNVTGNVSYYPITKDKRMLIGDYSYGDKGLRFRAELYRIGNLWKIIKISIK